jgi:hypothetical protein
LEAVAASKKEAADKARKEEEAEAEEAAAQVASGAGQPTTPLCRPAKIISEIPLGWPRHLQWTEADTPRHPPGIPHTREPANFLFQ